VQQIVFMVIVKLAEAAVSWRLCCCLDKRMLRFRVRGKEVANANGRLHEWLGCLRLVPQYSQLMQIESQALARLFDETAFIAPVCATDAPTHYRELGKASRGEGLAPKLGMKSTASRVHSCKSESVGLR
jgi:hypothetical protein